MKITSVKGNLQYSSKCTSIATQFSMQKHQLEFRLNYFINQEVPQKYHNSYLSWKKTLPERPNHYLSQTASVQCPLGSLDAKASYGRSCMSKRQGKKLSTFIQRTYGFNITLTYESGGRTLGSKKFSRQMDLN